METLDHFHNSGFGWICKHCETLSSAVGDGSLSRLLREGEAESKNPRLSTIALAKWTSLERDTLLCPKCGITEKVK